MKITKDDAMDIILDCHDDWELISETCIDERRWNNSYSVITKHIQSNKFYELSYECSRGEEGDRPFEYEEPELFEVEPVETKSIEYVRRK